MSNAATGVGPPDHRRRNVVVIMTDQQSASALSCAGNVDVATPHLDRLAAAGTRFTRAYCTQPLCTPSRSSLWTGRTPTELGTQRNATRLDETDVRHSLGRVVGEAGYDCGYAGKWHVPELDVPAYTGFRQIHPETEQGLVASCDRFLAEPRDRPFLLVASLTEPHGICEWARGQNPPSGFVPPADDELLPGLPQNYPVAAYEAELPRIAQDRLRSTTPAVGWTPDEWRQYRYAYLRLVERADAMIGEIVDSIETHGHLGDTVIIVTSDHGDQQGSHAWSQKWVLYEESINVPLIVVEPGGSEPGSVCTDLVSTGLDLLPTVAAVAGADVGRPLSGRSLLAEHRGPPGRDHVFTETEWVVPGINDLKGRTVRDGRYKYTCYAWGRHREQLVDLETDPGELHNLAPIGRHAERLRLMREVLRAEAERVGDHRFAGQIPVAQSGPR